MENSSAIANSRTAELPLDKSSSAGAIDDASKAEHADAVIASLGRKAKLARRALSLAEDGQKADALVRAATELRARADAILDANKQDVSAGKKRGLNAALLDRLSIDENRLTAMADAVEAIAMLPDPVGQVIDSSERPNGLRLDRVRVPLGVLGIIYESRPNVTADAAALGLRSGNAVILRGGSEAILSNRAIHAAMVAGIEAAGLPADAVQLMPDQDRALVGALLRADEFVDMIIPRGGKSLVERVKKDARVPVLAHLDGICHTYVHASASPEMARAVVLNAKMRRTGICGAMETLLVDRDFPDAAGLLGALADAGCELRTDDALMEVEPRAISARSEDWDTEYLDAIVSARMVSGLDDALDHISAHSSGHTDAIIAEDAKVAERFLAAVDSAICMWNSSSQFADGGEFGLGAEIGISTGRMHARGPVALEGLTTYKWLVRGAGQTRP